MTNWKIPNLTHDGHPISQLIVTRHAAFLTLIRGMGCDAPVNEHASEQDVLGKHIIGQAPLHIACYAVAQTLVPLDLPFELRGKELSETQLREFAKPPRTFIIREVVCSKDVTDL